MTKVNKRILMILITILVITVGSAAVAYAATTAVKVTAYQGVKIVYNGQELTGTSQPFIINNVTYVPLRLIMDNFEKNVGWDAVNYKVIITDGSAASSKELALSNQVATLQNQNAELQKTINSLKAQIATKGNNGDTSDIKKALEDAFEDAGDEYFDDDKIEFTFSLSGDEDDLAYTIKMDFGDADEYEDLSEISDNDIEEFLDDVESEINSETKNTNYKDADITGRLNDRDKSSYYVKYNGSSYTYSWDEDDTSISDIEDSVVDSFKNAGKSYFNDDGVDVDISLDGDEDDIAYEVVIDCEDSDYSDLSDISQSKLKTFLIAVKSKISLKIDNTDFEDAKITGYAEDDNHSKYYIKYNGSSYNYSW